MRFDEREGWFGLRIQVQLLVGLRAVAYSIAAYVQIFAFLDSSSRRHANDVIARSATRPFLDSRKRVPHFFPTSHPCIATLPAVSQAFAIQTCACHENPRDCPGRTCQRSQSRDRARTTRASDRGYRAVHIWLRCSLALKFESWNCTDSSLVRSQRVWPLLRFAEWLDFFAKWTRS